MTGTDLLAEVFRRSDVILAAWAFHVVVGGAVLGVAQFSGRVRGDRRARRLLAAAFAFYALTHLESMRWVLKQWGAAAAALKVAPDFVSADPAARGPLLQVIEAPDPVWVVPFHLVLDAFVLWVVLRPTRSEQEPSAGRPTPALGSDPSH